MDIEFEMSDCGLHRLARGEQTGDWAAYRSLSQLTVDGVTYVAGTEYGLLPKAGIVYRLEEV